MSYAYRHSVRGLWKDNHASYHFHTPVEYDVVAANKYKFLNADLSKFKLKNWKRNCKHICRLQHKRHRTFNQSQDSLSR